MSQNKSRSFTPSSSPSDPLAASRVGVSPPAPVAAPLEPEEPEVAEPIAAPPAEVVRVVRRFRVLERAKVSNGQATVTLNRGKVIDTVLYSAAFFAQCRKQGVRMEELPANE